MRCANCEREFDAAVGDCPYCGAVPEQNIRQTPGDFRQTTGKEGAGSYRRPRVSVRQVKFSGSGFLSQLIFIIFILLAVFIFLPAFIVIVLGVALVWFVMRLFRSY